MTLVAGPPGSGKTVFSSQFMYNGAVKYGIRGVYVCFAETRDSFLNNMFRFGWDFERLEREKRVVILDLGVTREAGLQTNLNTIMDTLTSIQAKRLVIDSFSAVSMALKESIDARVMVHLLYKFLKKAQCVSILAMDQPFGSPMIGDGCTEFVVDGIVYLDTYFDKRNVLRRKMEILKMRGTAHTKIPYEYDIDESGFKILKSEAPTTRRRAKKPSSGEKEA